MTRTPPPHPRHFGPGWLGSLAVLARYGRKHRRPFAAGFAAAVGVVVLRLVLPWPLKAMLDPWLTGDTPPGDSGTGHFVVLSVMFLGFVLALGLADLLERLFFARFSIGTIKDLRRDAFTTVRRRDARVDAGDAVARLIGDTARIKAGMKGFLVHVATNGVLLLGASAVLLWIYAPLGLAFGAATLVLMVVTVIGARAIHARASRYRKKEGRLASLVHGAIEADDDDDAFRSLDRGSGKHEASITRIQGFTTWCAHGIFGIVVLTTVVLAASAIIDERLDPGALVMLGMYILITRAPVVQLARQGARTGKIVACTDRVAALLARDGAATPAPPRSLAEGIELDGIRARIPRSRGAGTRLSIDRLVLPVGQVVAVVGKPASGKSSLLLLLEGRLRPRRGRVRWDGADVTGVLLSAPPARLVARAAHDPSWSRTALESLLRVARDPERGRAALALLEALGLDRLWRGSDRPLELRLSADRLSWSERRLLGTARALLSRAPLVLLDAPVAGLSTCRARRVLEAVRRSAEGFLVVVALDRPRHLDLFDRVIALRRGRIEFDGSPQDWMADRPAEMAPLDRVEGG